MSEQGNTSDKVITRAWWVLILTTLVVGGVGFFLIVVLGNQIEVEDPIVENFTPPDLFVQPDAEWNTSVLVAKSPETREIRRLTWFVFSIAGGIFLVVEGLLLYAIFRYRRTKKQRLEDGEQDKREEVRVQRADRCVGRGQ